MNLHNEKLEECPECGADNGTFHYDAQACDCGWHHAGGPRKTKQTQFGGIGSPAGQVGNCYPACFSSIMGLALDAVPHFYELHPLDNSDQTSPGAMKEIADFLKSKGWAMFMLNWPIDPYFQKSLSDSLVIVSGKSPRMEGKHAVVGKITEDGWELWNDPHPDGTGIEGTPDFIEVLFKTVRP